MCFIIAAVYIVIGFVLSFHYGSIAGDALSRVADARFVLQSRDPHLAAMGFVFTPLATMQLPLVAVMGAWPTLLAHAVPAIVVSALCMAGSVLQVAGMLRDRGASLGWTYGVALIYCVHPMIILYGANGMSEAPFLLFCTIACRFLNVLDVIRRRPRPGRGRRRPRGCLSGATTPAAGGFVALLVGATTWRRTRSDRENRLWAGATDAVVVVLPLIASFVLWAVVSWLLSGAAFAQFSSQYSNAAILQAADQAVLSLPQRVLFWIGETLGLAPSLLIALAIAGVVAWLWVVPEILPPLAIFGGVLAFQGASFAMGSTFGFLRFSIVAIPLVVILVGMTRPRQGLLVARHGRPGRETDRPRHRASGHAALDQGRGRHTPAAWPGDQLGRHSVTQDGTEASFRAGARPREGGWRSVRRGRCRS